MWIFKKYKRIVFAFSCFLLLFVLHLGYSYLSTELNVEGEITIKTEDKSAYASLAKVAVLDSVNSTYVNNETPGIDFSLVAGSTNGQGLYIRSGTENDTYPVYYYRGDVSDNNVIFAGFCWKIVRTTSTGGIKMIYNGEPDSNGACTATGTDTQVGTASYHDSGTSLPDIGYMQGGTRYTGTSKVMSSGTSGYVYGNTVTYSNGKYTLSNTFTSTSGWPTDYKTIGEGYHYTCFSSSTSCSSVSYIYNAGSNRLAYYYIFTGGTKINDAYLAMLPENNDTRNASDSAIKEVVDNWYASNMTSFTSYLEDTIWCNNRTPYLKNGFEESGNAYKMLYFGDYGKLVKTYEYDFSCPSDYDKFTTDSANGNGKLDYPVGMLTAEETALAGADWNEGDFVNYLITGSDYWTLSPMLHNTYWVTAFYVAEGGYLNNGDSTESFGIRPAISLKNGIEFTDGTGTSSDPYIVE